MTEAEIYRANLALTALVSLSVKPEWSTEEHSRFYFKTMDKRETLEDFYEVIKTK